jgi:hypothetical protein
VPSRSTVRVGKERNFTTTEIISVFPLWTFHSYVATFQQHPHMEYISLRVNLVTNPVMSHAWGKYLRQVEHIRGHLWHRYCIAVNQVMVATVKFLNSLWYLQTLFLSLYYLYSHWRTSY